MRARFGMGAFLLLALAACGGDGVVDLGGGPPPSNAPTLTSLQSSIFTPRCAVLGCHASAAPEQGMDLSAGTTFSSTVNVDATEVSGFKRVAPGQASNSYLYMKVAGDPRIAGDRMPADGTTLSAFDVEAIRAWIDAGAQDN